MVPLGTLPPIARRTHQILLWWARKYGDRVYPSQTRLASKLGVSVRSVKRAIRDLKEAGILVVARTNMAKSRHRTNRYTWTTAWKILNTPAPKTIKKPYLKLSTGYPQVVGNNVKSVDNHNISSKNVPSIVVKPSKSKLKSKSYMPRKFFKPKSPPSWAVQKAIDYSKSEKYAPLYRKAEKIMGEALLTAAVRDVQDEERAKEYETPIRCRGSYLTAVLKNRIMEFCPS